MIQSFQSRYFLFFQSFLLCILINSWKPAFSNSTSSYPVQNATQALQEVQAFRFEPVYRAIDDMTRRFGEEYPNGKRLKQRLTGMQQKKESLVDSYKNSPEKITTRLIQYANDLAALKREALLANPLLNIDGIMVVKRRNRVKGMIYPTTISHQLGIPSNHECNSSLPKDGYDNELIVISDVQTDKTLHTLYKPKHDGYVGMMDLHWDADRLLFTQSDSSNWKIWEVKIDGSGLRQVSQMPEDVDAMDAVYLPDGKVLFGSTASYQSVPCWHGQRWVCNLYSMNADGSGVRQLCFDQDHNYHPSVTDTGQILYTRWDYTGINHIFFRQLMLMNPDGTGQRAVYGSNTWYPNSLFFARQIPGIPGQYISILSGYHGVHKMGQLAVVDTKKGWQDADGLVKRISGKGDAFEPKIADALVDKDWPKFLHPYPLNDTYFLVSVWNDQQSNWAIYLADRFDNLTLIYEDPDYALFEPIPLMKRTKPPVIPSHINENCDEGVVYLQDVHTGPGLAGVPKGTIKHLRVLAYHFGYRHLAGPHKIGYGGPWEAMRILGTVPLEKDGSAIFTVPAKTPIAVQALDQNGRAVQLMRSWFTLMPGELRSCVGCHESPNTTPAVQTSAAAYQKPRAITPWYGPPRGFDFAREVQPVLNRYCIECHNGDYPERLDLRAEESVPDYKGVLISSLGVKRLHPTMQKATHGYIKYTPAYDALLPYIRRVGIEDDVSLLVPGEYHADTSELVQILKHGHHGVRLDDESWDRIVTWIDLNAPCHGTWSDVFPIPESGRKRREELQQLFGGPKDDPEHNYGEAKLKTRALSRVSIPKKKLIDVNEITTQNKQLSTKLNDLDHHKKTIELDDGLTLELIKVPAGRFVMGDLYEDLEEYPPRMTSIDHAFWIGRFEITNQQYQLFDPYHNSRYYAKRHAKSDDQGMPLNHPNQPAVRVSWEQAMAYCDWLSQKTGMTFTLPTEEQWEFACRAGSGKTLFYGSVDDDFSLYANLAGEEFSKGQQKNGLQITGGVEHLALEGAVLSETRFHDGFVVTSPIGSFQPNAFGIFDMHGNVSEWTLSNSRLCGDSDHDDCTITEEKIVRGGSFFDRPERSRSASWMSYPKWRRIFHVGFRVVVNE